jgi:hypothetical protein
MPCFLPTIDFPAYYLILHCITPRRRTQPVSAHTPTRPAIMHTVHCLLLLSTRCSSRATTMQHRAQRASSSSASWPLLNHWAGPGRLAASTSSQPRAVGRQGTLAAWLLCRGPCHPLLQHTSQILYILQHCMCCMSSVMLPHHTRHSNIHRPAVCTA